MVLSELSNGEIISEHLEMALLFALIGTLTAWIAWKRRFFQLSSYKKAPKIRHPLLALLIYVFLFVFATSFVIKFFYFIYSPLKTIFESHPPLLVGTAQVLSIIIIASFVTIFSAFQRRGVMEVIWKKDFTLLSALKDFGVGALAWLICFPLVACIDQIGELLTFLLVGVTHLEQVAVRYVRLSAESPYLLTVALISTVLAAPILEELIFRGFIYTYLKSKLGQFKALISSSLIFALFHFSPDQGIQNFTLIFTLFTLALFLAFLYEKKQSLIAPIALHMTFNSISVMRIVLFSS